MSDNQFPTPLSAILLPLFAIIAILLAIPQLIIQIKLQNIAATALISWLILLNTSNAINPLIWPTGDWDDWWMGRGYCDIQVRIIVGVMTGALPGCAVAMSRQIAKALDMNRMVVHQDRLQKRYARRKEWVFEGVLCFGLPFFFMVAYYLVQNFRYFIVPVYGCSAPFDRSWVTVLLFFVPPIITNLISTYYSVLILHRLYLHKTQIVPHLPLSPTAKTRFTSLTVLTILSIPLTLAASIYTLISFSISDTNNNPLHTYDWTHIHTDWNVAVLIPASYARIHWDRWIWIFMLSSVFWCFGVGKEEKSLLTSLGFGRFFHSQSQSQSQSTPEEAPASTLKSWYEYWFKSDQGEKPWHGRLTRGIIVTYKSRREGAATRKNSASNSSNTTLAWRNSLWATAPSTAFSPTLPLTPPQPSHQPQKKSSKWSSFINMPGSFAQAVAGAQNLPRQPNSSASMTSVSSRGSNFAQSEAFEFEKNEKRDAGDCV